MHVLGLFIAAMTLQYRKRALIPLYVFILLDGVYRGFSFWWISYLYVWLPLWGMFMLAGRCAWRTANTEAACPSPHIPSESKSGPKSKPKSIFGLGARSLLYMILCALHGLTFGTLTAPAHAFFYGLNFSGMLAWISAGIPFDIMHATGNFAAGTLIIPLAALLNRLEKSRNPRHPH